VERILVYINALKDLINLEGGRYAIYFGEEKMYKTNEKHNF